MNGTPDTPAEGGSYEIIDGERVLVERTSGEGKRGTTDVCPAIDPSELAAPGVGVTAPSEKNADN